MGSKKKAPAAPTSDLQTLKIGSHVRCTDDGIMGRIVWANAASVKIRWDDGEQVTWRRDSLPGRPIEILDPDATADESVPTEQPAATATEDPTSPPQDPESIPPTTGEAATPEVIVAPQTDDAGSALPTIPAEAAPPAPAKPKSQRKAPTQPKATKPSALDAAAKVLHEAGKPMTCQEMIAAMSAKGYWSSPAGKTPAATLYSAILREITTKGDAARFTKTERGKFALRLTV
jgi:hypothetical protein